MLILKKIYVTIPVYIFKKDLLKAKELTHYVNVIADDATSNASTNHRHYQESHQKR